MTDAVWWRDALEQTHANPPSWMFGPSDDERAEVAAMIDTHEARQRAAKERDPLSAVLVDAKLDLVLWKVAVALPRVPLHAVGHGASPPSYSKSPDTCRRMLANATETDRAKVIARLPALDRA